jgi:tRNA threonylcarbamoyladenosine biosynthesis protein TsaB
MTPRLLALDTATDVLALGLATPAGRWHRQAPGGAQASAALLPAIGALAAEAGLALQDLDAIAFGQGPGAFTGLRTACAVAQGLALGLDRPLLAIDSLLIVAEDARTQHGGDDWWVSMDARMDEVYAAAYRHDGQRWQTQQAPQLWTRPALAQAWQAAPPQRVAGSAVTAFPDGLPWGDTLRVGAETDRAAALLRLAEAAWADGERLDAAQALPLYLRDKVALTTDERLALKAAA